MSMEQLALLAPDYEIRASNRAKYAQIRITPAGRVLVVVPRRFDMKRVPAFVAEHRQWIDNKLQQLQQAHNPVYDSDSPQRIVLRAVDETWQVSYNNPGAQVQLYDAASSPVPPALSVRINNHRPIRPQLLRWLNDRARAVLSDRVERLAQETGLSPQAISIRGQKTRWGSCSARRTISLNRSLLFLPPPLVRYLIVHELCHLVHLNHSQRYWRLVQRFEPGYQQLDRDLSAAARYIPHWALPE